MQLLPVTLTKNGYYYKQIKKGNKSAIYEQTCEESPNPIAYEVFRIKIDKEKVVFGQLLPEKEIFPGNEDFGKWAWTFHNPEQALLRFEVLENEDIPDTIEDEISLDPDEEEDIEDNG